MGGKFFAIAGLVVTGIVIADILSHPSGTSAATNGLANILSPTYSALLGTVPGNPPAKNG